MNNINIIPVIAIFLCIVTRYAPSYAHVKLPGFAGDSMVVQRDTQLKIWGWASAGENVAVTFRGKRSKTVTGTDGKWSIMLTSGKAGGPYEMTITGSNKITLRNILVGDVWLCAGQSNMVHNFERHKDRYANDIALANYPEIRQFLIPTLTNLQGPADNLPRSRWTSADAHSLLKFSVVAYFFAKDLHEKFHVPIGIINASVGGTPIEAWTSEDGLKNFPALLTLIQQNKDTSYINGKNRLAKASQEERARIKSRDEGLTGPTTWYDPAYSPKNWHTINIPGYWEDQGVKDLDGAVWYRREFDVPTSMTEITAKVELGRVVDADFLYINGVLVGNTTYQYPQRRYQIPAGVLKPGKNILTIRVLNYSGKGGFVPDKPYEISAGGQVIDLKGYWHYRVGEIYDQEKIYPEGISAQHQPTALFNAMIAPLKDYAIKGVVWYQGETNADKPQEYKKLLPAFVADWRSAWGRGDVPFLFVQLPNFMEMNYKPSESKWAEMREAQLQALAIANTGLVVTIDLGEWNDIHPGNKKPVGERLALAAQKAAYGQHDIVFSGPVFQSAKVEGDKIILRFSNVGSGLISVDGEKLAHFAIAGADKKFTWADARIVNNTVVVSGENVPDPLYVRYAWADNPQGANLYNKEQLPASPFRTDN